MGLSTSTLTFATQGVGTTSLPQIVTLTNTGNGPLSFTGISLTGTNPGDFAQSSNCLNGVAAAADCAISITFTPTTDGARGATVSISDNAAGSPQSITLSGTGATTTPAGTYPLTVTATSGSLSHTVTVTLTVQ